MLGMLLAALAPIAAIFGLFFLDFPWDSGGSRWDTSPISTGLFVLALALLLAAAYRLRRESLHIIFWRLASGVLIGMIPALMLALAFIS